MIRVKLVCNLSFIMLFKRVHANSKTNSKTFRVSVSWKFAFHIPFYYDTSKREKYKPATCFICHERKEIKCNNRDVNVVTEIEYEIKKERKNFCDNYKMKCNITESYWISIHNNNNIYTNFTEIIFTFLNFPNCSHALYKNVKQLYTRLILDNVMHKINRSSINNQTR